mmetsp:Transcript_68087/g.120450  ORF Transcript_68087/g.120450 Transcript_68087/m.120450 type:complete len:207 (+) Transcript_68087:206-826(+)
MPEATLDPDVVRVHGEARPSSPVLWTSSSRETRCVRWRRPSPLRRGAERTLSLGPPSSSSHPCLRPAVLDESGCGRVVGPFPSTGTAIQCAWGLKPGTAPPAPPPSRPASPGRCSTAAGWSPRPAFWCSAWARAEGCAAWQTPPVGPACARCLRSTGGPRLLPPPSPSSSARGPVCRPTCRPAGAGAHAAAPCPRAGRRPRSAPPL